MVPQASNRYLKTSDGYYVAWSLEVPSPYSEWSLVSVLCPQKPRLQLLCDWKPRLMVVPYRPLTNEEVSQIKNRPLLLWGMKVVDQPWALAMCQPSGFSTRTSVSSLSRYDSSRSIGV